MSTQAISPDLQQHLLSLQQDEITSHHIYMKLAEITPDEHNRETLRKIAGQEQRHYQTLKNYTQRDVEPDQRRLRVYFWIARLLGLTFGIKLMEKGEEQAQSLYSRVLQAIPDVGAILKDEEQHETELIDMIDEESLKYIGSVVLGLNDALVELTGALAGLTFAFQNTHVIALAGLITGISASMSMAASEYLSNQASEDGQSPSKSALYTGIAYVFTVAFLVFPYLIASNFMVCLAWTMINAIVIIAAFNYYISVARDQSFRHRFLQMTSISLGVALLSFLTGVVIRQVFGVNV
jgi:VIT1/CCC1 family predicted Fe2+/Mn2+ transporter